MKSEVYMDKSKVVLLIPSLNPDEKLVKLVNGLCENGFSNIFVVNDGSKQECLKYFDELKKIEGTNLHIFSHYKNFGKGRALKNAFNQIYYTFPDFECVVTLDGDGQHAIEDVIKVAEMTLENKEKLVLGSREFGKDVPFRSKFGNILTRGVMKALCGINVRDTQTGLRGFSRDLLKEFLDIPGERYEYEMNVLIETKNKDIKIVECPIQTIYLEENKSSHFNPIKDSIRIYSLFIKFIIAAFASFIIDLACFAIFVKVFKNISYAYYIFIATVLARVISSVFNFFINKNSVFKNKNNTKKQNIFCFVYYAVLVLINMAISSFAVNAVVKGWGWNETLTKLIVDTLLFIMNFVIEREFIFKNRRKK